MKKTLTNEELYKRAVLHLNKSLGLNFDRILERANVRYSRKDVNDCSIIALCDYLAGELKGEEKERVDRHLKTCNDCRKLVRILERKNRRKEFKEKLLPRLVSKLLPKSSVKERRPMSFDFARREAEEY